MPELDGIELLQTIVKNYPTIPVIIFSGMGTMVDVIKALRIGAWDYITKPIVDLEILHHSVGKALNHSELLHQKKNYQASLENELLLRTEELLQKNTMLKQEIKNRQIQETLVLHAKQEWERTVDAMPDMVAIIDTEYNIVRLNKTMLDRTEVSPMRNS